MKKHRDNIIKQEEQFFNHLTPTAQEYFEALDQLLKSDVTEASYLQLYALLQRLCEDHSKEFDFPNLFSCLGYVCRKYQIPLTDQIQLQQLRRQCYHLSSNDYDKEVFKKHLRLIADFIARVMGKPVPLALQQQLPIHVESTKNKLKPNSFYPYLRVIVKRWDSTFIYAEKDDATNDAMEICIDYTKSNYEDEDNSYIISLLRPDLPINIIKVIIDDEGHYIPQSIILLPDFLVDVSSLAACFKEYGHDARNYILSQIEPHRNTDYTLLGNLVGIFLDDFINHEDGDTPVTYKESVKRAFAEQPLPYSLLELNKHFNFHQEAWKQFNNIQELVSQKLESQYGFQLNKALIEPSFICEALGLSGRMDLLQSDYSRLIEQKSGKYDEFRQTHREPHFVQMMLYQAILEYIDNKHETHIKNCQAYLLYSKYQNGFLLERRYVKLLREALRLRNEIVMQELNISEGELRQILFHLTPDELNTKGDSKLWSIYQRPQLEKLLEPFSQKYLSTSEETHQIALDYFFRFYTFIVRENILSKLHCPGNTGQAFSDLWNLPTSMRRELGGLFMGLKITQIAPIPKQGKGIKLVTLCINNERNNLLTNFRVGDAILLYRYTGDEPDVRRQFLMRGRLRIISSQNILVELNHPQQNLSVFHGEDTLFAIEHDFIEANSRRLLSGLYSFLIGNRFRQELLLSKQSARTKATQKAFGNYGMLQEMIEKERASEDYFLVIGPPGSGKTSQAIRFMVEEELRCQSGKILLLAYTNRAVDELCGMLESICREQPDLLTDYIRIGAELSAEPLYRNRFLSARMAVLETTADVRDFLNKTQIFVATVSTISAQTELLSSYHFSVAIFDEASQILEPYLLPILFAESDNAPSIARFVLVGDQKQLPAVVQQSLNESAIKEKTLIDAGITDCRKSLFERLLNKALATKRNDLYFLLERQGRMHPELFDFVNRYFYQNKLNCVPLPHQQRSLSDIFPHSIHSTSSQLETLLANRRVAFFDCISNDNGSNYKINLSEAHLAAQCLDSLNRIYCREGQILKPEQVGIIVPYRNQISVIRKEIEQLGMGNLSEITIDTVERYQGSQKDIIFFLFTIHHSFQLQFLAASTYLEQWDNIKPYWVDRKLNVALTRAREQLFLIGNASLLSQNPVYKKLLTQIRKNKSFFTEKQLSRFLPPR